MKTTGFEAWISGIPEQRRREPSAVDRPSGYYVNEPDWASNTADEAIDPDALMALFDSRRQTTAYASPKPEADDEAGHQPGTRSV